MNNIIASIARLTAGTVFMLGLAFTAQAQSLPSDLMVITASEIPRSVCNYYSIQEFSLWPPLPFNWLNDSNVVLYVSPSLGTNAIFVGDLAVDYAEQALEAQVMGLAAGAANGRTSPDDNTDSGAAGFDYTTNDLWLELVSLTNDSTASATLLIHAPQPSVFDLFFAPSLPPANSQGWYWVARALPGETNLSVPNLPTAAGFFILGTPTETLTQRPA